MIRLCFVVQTPDEGNVGHVALESGPLDCFKSGVPRRQYVIGVILNDVVGDRTSIAVNHHGQ